MRKIFIAVIIFLGLSFIFYRFFYQKNNSSLVTDVKKSSPVSFIVFGDSGTGSDEQKKLAEVMREYSFDMILHTGDIVYPYGSVENYESKFSQIYKEHLQKSSFYPAPGNHDYQSDNLLSYLKLFELPSHTFKKQDNERYYSFDKENIHFISLDTNTPLYQISDTDSDDMADWLVADLEKNKNKEWKIVYFHHPPYSSGTLHGDDYRVQNFLVPILEKYGVDVVFSGHEHNYERTCKLQKNVCGEKGITYIVTGGGGAGVYAFGDAKVYSEFRSPIHHFVKVAIESCSLKSEVIGLKKQVIDSFRLEKC